MKTLASLMVTALAVATLALPTSAQGTAQVLVDGNPIAFDQPPILQAGRVLVPLRGIFENMGATVVYDAPTRTVHATSADNRSITLPLGSTLATLNGQSFRLDVPAQVVAGRTLVPLRFVAESLGAEVVWQPATRTVAISSPAEPVAEVPAEPQPPAQPPVVSAPEGIPGIVVLPRGGSTIPTLTPTLWASLPDPIDPTTARLLINGTDVTRLARVSPNEVVYVANNELGTGQHIVQLDALTPGGAPLRLIWDFTIGSLPGWELYSVQLRPEGRPVVRGEDLVVVAQGLKGSRVTMNVGDAFGIPMTETEPGVYVGRYTVTAQDQGEAMVTVDLVGALGQRGQIVSEQRAALWGNPALQR